MVNKVYKFTKTGSGSRVMLPNKNKSNIVTGTGLLFKQEIKGTASNPQPVRLQEITNKLEKLHIGSSLRPMKKSYINFKL